MQSVVQALDPSFLAEVASRVATIAVAIGVGVFLANVAVAFGAVRYITVLAYPLTRPANLPREVGTAILTTTASTTAGYGMLAEFRDSGMLDDRATLVAVTINTFFGFVQHIFTFYAPVLIPILGLRVGLMYVGARAAIALGITLVGILAGALLLSGRNVNSEALPDEIDAPDREAQSTPEKLRGAATSTWKKLRRIVPRLAVVYALVTLLVETNSLQALTSAADPLATLVGLPGAAVPVIAVFAFDTTTGAVTIAPQIGSVFTPRQAVATMLLGGIVSFAVSTFKRSIPFQYGIWGASFGSKVVAVNTALKVVFIGVAVAVLLVP
ncbi:nucleoside recognition protein [Haloprofundus sp. MHR1]|uniref:nucleoside recognition protein n=1 Tax=Haloprofundus sp. MHR1 TaxID=2572921 RepID=UPI0010BE5C8B|nr:nucleoside recognition protein [Haloprofundus sp. MHR1]QCJ46929.1 nucleoside recognition protein [Haloprofundus sp. MHR1]